jgi:hypothetical protein
MKMIGQDYHLLGVKPWRINHSMSSWRENKGAWMCGLARRGQTGNLVL